MKRLSRLTPLLSLLLAPCLAHAFPTAGLTVPLPEALPEGTFQVQLEHHGSQVLQATEAEQVLGLQAGVGWGLEVGVDMRWGAPHDDWLTPNYRRWDLRYDPAIEGFEDLWFNVKKQLFTETRHRPAAAFGLLNLGAEGDIAQYAVVGKHFGKWQGCLGWSNAYNDDRWYELVAYDQSEDWRYLVEHISTGRFSTSFGAEYRVNEHYTVTAAFMKANNSYYDHDVLLNATYQDQW